MEQISSVSRTSLFDLSGKLAVVTGARSGIGQSISIALAEAGANIIGVGKSAMPETRRAVESHGRSFHEEPIDLREHSDFSDLVARIADRSGPIDILINNAGIIRTAPVLEYSAQDWDDVVSINMRSVFLLSQAVARGMAEIGSGRIINIASLVSLIGGTRVAAYAASKHAVLGITRALSNELAPLGITVNAIAPGFVETALTAGLQADIVRRSQIDARIPIGRWATPDDLRTSVLFLASPASGYVTGAVIPVDGGWLAR